MSINDENINILNISNITNKENIQKNAKTPIKDSYLKKAYKSEVKSKY